MCSIVMLLPVSTRAQGPLSPNIDCIVVAPNGEITIIWTQPNDPNGFGVGYRIFNVDPFSGDEVVVFSSNNFNLTSTVIPDLDGNDDFHCFHMVTTWNDGSPQFSDPGEMACNIHLDVTASPNPGIIQIAWNFPNFEDPSTQNGTFTLLLEYPAGVWNVLAELDYESGNNIYFHEVDVCSAELNFQVEFIGDGGCIYYSNVDGGTFQDQIDPSAPEIISVSVDSLSHNAQIFWNPPPQNDVVGYIIYQCTPGFNPVPLDTIFDANILFWQNEESTANMGVEYYNIAAFDSCYTASGDPDPGAGNQLCTGSILLTHQWQTCSDAVVLNWNSYNGWDDGVDSYEIYAAEEPIPGSGDFLPSFTLAVVDGNTTTYTHQGTNLGSSYRYRVRAVANSNGYEAFSNRRTATVFYPESPQYTYIRQASVIDRNLVEVTVAVGTGGATDHTFILERLRSTGDTYDTRDASVLAGPGELVFLDEVNNSAERSYTYRIRVTNSCGDEVNISNDGVTVVLTGFVNSESLSNSIRWTTYENWDNAIQRYEIYRRIDNEEVPQLLATVPGSIREYTDDVSQMLYTEGEFCYTVVAVENGNGYTLPGEANSNELCLTQEPVIWVPNAFLINGFNNSFKPVISFADFDNYRMQIYSRWGDMIFESQDIEEAWDGVYRDRLVPEGIYAWFISISDGAGRIYEKRGTVMMMVGPED